MATVVKSRSALTLSPTLGCLFVYYDTFVSCLNDTRVTSNSCSGSGFAMFLENNLPLIYVGNISGEFPDCAFPRLAADLGDASADCSVTAVTLP